MVMRRRVTSPAAPAAPAAPERICHRQRRRYPLHSDRRKNPLLNHLHRNQLKTPPLNHLHRNQLKTPPLNHLHRNQLKTPPLNHLHRNQLKTLRQSPALIPPLIQITKQGQNFAEMMEYRPQSQVKGSPRIGANAPEKQWLQNRKWALLNIRMQL